MAVWSLWCPDLRTCLEVDAPIILSCKLECFIGISSTEKNRITASFFTCVWDSQSAADMSLTLFSVMNEWQRVFFLKHEWSRLLLVSKRCLYNKPNYTWLLGDMEFLFAALTREMSSWTLQEKFRISAHSCLILYIFLQSVTSGLYVMTWFVM